MIDLDELRPRVENWRLGMADGFHCQECGAGQGNSICQECGSGFPDTITVADVDALIAEVTELRSHLLTFMQLDRLQSSTPNIKRA